MTGKIACAVAMLLLVSSVGLADDVGLLAGSIWQYQNFMVGTAENPGMSSVLQLTHGDVTASTFQDVDIENNNESPAAQNCQVWCVGSPWNGCGGWGDDCDTTASQYQIGEVQQKAEADGECGVLTVQSYLGADGEQNQVIGASTSGANQGQALEVGAVQALVRQDGAADGSSVNSADLYQEQTGHNAAGTYGEDSWLDVYQKAEVDGAANSTAAVLTNLTAGTSQLQVVY